MSFSSSAEPSKNALKKAKKEAEKAAKKAQRKAEQATEAAVSFSSFKPGDFCLDYLNAFEIVTSTFVQGVMLIRSKICLVFTMICQC